MLNLCSPFRGFRFASRSSLFWWHALILWSLVTATAAMAATPDYLHVALGKFNPEVPNNWAYSITTERDGKKMTERFDPSKPPAQQWSLLRNDNRTPTSEEQEKYFKYKASQNPGAIQATFHKGDIEPGTLKLVREDADRADFTCSFREQSANADKMLGHLSLLLTISKQGRYVEKSSLTLNAPYNPVLTVKMRELVVTMTFSPPTDHNPSLPSASSSHFLGRIFFISMEENLKYEYFDFAPAT